MTRRQDSSRPPRKSPRLVTDEDVAAWARMYEQRMTVTEIGSAVGAAPSFVWRSLKEAGVPIRGRGEPAKPALARFERKWTPEPNTGCWLWKGSAHTYGYFGHADEEAAHRVSWTLHRGPIPDGVLVLHVCDVPGCVNPDHLFLGSAGDNSADMVRKGRHGRPHAKKTHCLRGHSFSGNNLLISKGERVCRACKRLFAARRRAKKKGAPK